MLAAILMLMTYVPEIGARNPYQKTGTINRHKNKACPENRYHNNSVPNCTLNAPETGTGLSK